MDIAGICMWLDVLIGPNYQCKRGKALLIWDNCGSHNTKAVKDLLAVWGITERKLPKNMTGKHQIMDLVVNGPYKAAIRRKRIASLFQYMQSWKVKRLQEMAKAAEERELPPFKPPKPRHTQCSHSALNARGESMHSVPVLHKEQCTQCKCNPSAQGKLSAEC